MATQKPGGGWDLTDADVDAIAAASGFDVEREQVADNPDPADHQDSPDSGLIDWAARAVETAPPEARSDKDPAYHTGRVDFSEMLHTDAQWSLKHRFDELLGRPYLSTQLAAMLPADVALRLVERAEKVVASRVEQALARIGNEIAQTTENTLNRLQQETDEKLKELRRERFKPTRLS